MRTNRILTESAGHAVEETWAVAAASATRNPALLLARLGDLARSNAFLWAEAGLQVQEQATRAVQVGQPLSRALVLLTVASDIFIGYTALRGRAEWLPFLVKPRDWELQHQRSANRVLETSASLGGALIKASQFASTRPDLLPAAYIRSLAPLQDRMPPRPWSDVEQAITRELGRRPADVFAEIERAPVGAASIAQVHRARLPDGREVAVKVQYPDAEQLVAIDLAVLERIVRVIAQVAPAIQLQPIVEYLKGTLPLELDFRHEAESIAGLRQALAHRADVHVPAVVPELSTRRLLVLDYVEGITITDRAALERAGISPRAVARLLADVYAEQMLQVGVLHADPHPGNLRVQPGPRLVLLDHGLTVPLAPALVAALKRMVQALAAGDVDALTAALADAGLSIEAGVDFITLMNVVGVLLGNDQPAASGEAGDAVEVGVQLGKSIGSIPLDLLLVGRALGLVAGITKQLDPDMDAMAMFARYAESAYHSTGATVSYAEGGTPSTNDTHDESDARHQGEGELE